MSNLPGPEGIGDLLVQVAEEQREADEAEERRLERELIDSTMRAHEAGSFEHTSSRFIRDIDDACARLAAFRKEKGTR